MAAIQASRYLGLHLFFDSHSWKNIATLPTPYMILKLLLHIYPGHPQLSHLLLRCFLPRVLWSCWSTWGSTSMTGDTVRGKFLGVRTLQVHFRHTTVKSNLIISSLSPKFLIGQLVLPADSTVFLRQLMMNTWLFSVLPCFRSTAACYLLKLSSRLANLDRWDTVKAAVCQCSRTTNHKPDSLHNSLTEKLYDISQSETEHKALTRCRPHHSIHWYHTKWWASHTTHRTHSRSLTNSEITAGQRLSAVNGQWSLMVITIRIIMISPWT